MSEQNLKEFSAEEVELLKTLGVQVDTEDADLVAPGIAQRGSDAFFAEFMKHEQTIKHYFRRMTRDGYLTMRSDIDAQDLYQDMILEMHRVRLFEKFDPTLGNFNKYLFHHMHYLCRRFHSARVRANKWVSEASFIPSEELSLRMECRKTQSTVKTDDVRDFENLLDEQELMVLTQMVEEDADGSDVARTTGLNLMKVSRIRKRIRQKASEFFGITAVA